VIEEIAEVTCPRGTGFFAAMSTALVFGGRVRTYEQALSCVSIQI